MMASGAAVFESAALGGMARRVRLDEIGPCARDLLAQRASLTEVTRSEGKRAKGE